MFEEEKEVGSSDMLESFAASTSSGSFGVGEYAGFGVDGLRDFVNLTGERGVEGREDIEERVEDDDVECER